MGDEGDVHSRKLLRMCKRHFNEPFLANERVARLIGYGETGVDCYIIAQHLAAAFDARGKIIWHTCVGGYIFLNRLKRQGYVKSTTGEDWDDFSRLDSVLMLNGAPKQKENQHAEQKPKA